MATRPHEAPAPAQAVGIVVVLTVVLAVIFVAFALPATKSAPRDVPIGVAGPPPAITAIESGLARNAPGSFAVTTYDDRDSLADAIRNREVYGGLSAGPQGPTLLLATGASPMVAQALTQLGTAMAQNTGMPLHTEDLAPLPGGDPRGVGLAAAALPLTLAALLPAIALVVLFNGRPGLQTTTMIGFAAVASLTVTALLRYLFGSIEQHFWGVTAALFVGITATGLALLGLGALFGRVGLGLGAAAAILLGNPLSGINSAPELLPGGWGAFGQLLPQGANATLLRSAAYFGDSFPDQRASTALVVLGCWAAAGALMIAVAWLRQRRSRA
ncbi:ABC transporter permease [[Mycobacterium] wendilense]|uniref:ABC transporter permease n=1 Tax=[Mycobacterium] wendilense TaxID=3064284 RepID=A0ABM9MIG4_9MYCO|nr:ABC transporter permease [Mycolicibacterium sp. MU0050]CAJ1585969.1 ABC transporter permease [Mycolicibacterium sp. MU0050]